MSGATMGTGPRPKASPPGTGRGDAKERMRDYEVSVGGVMGSLSVIDLQLVAFIIVFSASGLVPLLDLIFPVFLSAYAIFLAAFVFPSYSAGKPADVFRGNRAFQVYVMLGTAIGLFLPLAYVLGGFAQGDRTAVRDAAPHLYLLSFQVLSENVINGLGIFSLPVRALLPVLYTTRRLFAGWGWLVGTWTHVSGQKERNGVVMNPLIPDYAWTLFGRTLAVVNFVYFLINLFFFLIPMFLPRAFETYFNERAVYLSKHHGKGKGKGVFSVFSDHTPKEEPVKKAEQQVHSRQGQEPEKKAE